MATLCAQTLATDSLAWADVYSKIEQLRGSDLVRAINLADSLVIMANNSGDSVRVAEAYKLKGDLYWNNSQLSDAIVWLNLAGQLANRLQNRELAVRVNNNLGGVYIKAAKYDKALSHYNQAYSLGRGYLNNKQKASLSNNLGVVYRNLKQFKESRLYLLEALEINTLISDTIGIAQSYNNLGLVASDLKAYDQALNYFNKALEINRVLNRARGIGYAEMNIGTIYLYQNKIAEARKHFTTSYNIRIQHSDQADLFNAELNLGKVFLAENKPDSALQWLESGLSHARNIGNLKSEDLVLRQLAIAYGMLGDSARQISTLNNLLELKDSINHTELTERIAIADAEAGLIKKNQKIEALEQFAENQEEQLHTRETVLILTAILAFLLLLFIAFYLQRFRSERKVNSELLAHNEEINRQKSQIEQQHELIQLKNSELVKANDLIEHYNEELQTVNEELEDRIRERTKALTDTYRKLSFHINNTPLAMLEWNKDLELIRWPEQASQIFGLKASEVLGLKAEQLLFMQDSRHQEFLKSIQDNPTAASRSLQDNFHQEYTNSAGELLSIEWSHSVLTDGLGKIESILSIANNVSLREAAYQEVKSINQELDTFIYKASHDLRGPIARMQGIINLGKLESSEAKAHFYFDLLTQVTAEFHLLLGRLLTVHDIQQNIICLENFKLESFTSSLTSELNTNTEHNVQILNYVDSELRVTSDKGLLKIIFKNLLENSLVFADNVNPKIIIKAVIARRGSLQIKVQDNGPGISDEVKDKVFDMFYQGSTKSTGTGLGLYMVRKAARKLGGDVVLSQEDGLTTFTVTLPKSDLIISNDSDVSPEGHSSFSAA